MAYRVLERGHDLSCSEQEKQIGRTSICRTDFRCTALQVSSKEISRSVSEHLGVLPTSFTREFNKVVGEINAETAAISAEYRICACKRTSTRCSSSSTASNAIAAPKGRPSISGHMPSERFCANTTCATNSNERSAKALRHPVSQRIALALICLILPSKCQTDAVLSHMQAG